MRIPFLAPECLQLSSMDCGVAAVHTLLRGHGLDVDYQTLRERCQTGVDGTSIDSLEDLCNELGVEVEQHVLPVDLAVSAMAGRYPLIAIVRRGRGVPHFVTVWSRLGRYLQVMDPAGGRVWVHEAEFERELYPHPFCLPHAQWADWMSCNSYREALTARAKRLLSEKLCLQEVNEVLEHAEPGALRNLDAALRLVQRTSRATGQNRRAWNDRLFTRARSHFAERPAAANAFASISLEPDALCTHGTVLLMRAQAGGRPQVNGRAKQNVSSPESRPEDSARQIPTHRPSNPGWLRSLLRLLGPQARVLALGLFGAVLMLALASALELLLYRAAVDAPNLFTTFDTRFAAALSLGSLVLVLLGLETAAAYGAANLGRHLELELRVRTLYSLPRTGDAFVRSRPTTDLAYRAHNLVTGGRMPATLIAAARAVGDLGVTLVAIAWLGTAYLLPVSIGALLLVITLSTSRNRLRELDTRNQVHASRLLSLFLDALRGCRPIRLHGYQDSFRLEQQRELERSRLTAEALVRTGARLEAVNGAFGALLLVGVLLVFVANAADPRLFVLLAFWAFRIPPTIRALVGFAQAQPLQSVALQRLLEVTHYVKDEPDTVPDQPGPIEDRQHAAQEPAARAEPSPIEAAAAGVAIEFEGLTVLANQYAILNDVSLRVAAGEHVAIVGRSGSGKSSLVGLLLGFHEPTAGRLTFDGRAYGAHERRRLLSQTVWVDPSVQLWNRSVRDNVEYAARATARRGFLQTAELSELLPVIDHLERGLDTSVGPEGCLLSGGEGQRVRLARGLRRAEVRLVILDEAFRGLDRPMRERLTRNVRAAFPNATLFSVSHDIRSALEFERVLVIESGRIVEDGAPTRLAGTDSRFKSLLDAETRALEELWAERAWRRLEVARGKVTDEHPIH